MRPLIKRLTDTADLQKRDGFGVSAALLNEAATHILAMRAHWSAREQRAEAAERERDEANARAATILQETTAMLEITRGVRDAAVRDRNVAVDERNAALNRATQAERERDELRAAFGRVRDFLDARPRIHCYDLVCSNSCVQEVYDKVCAALNPQPEGKK